MSTFIPAPNTVQVECTYGGDNQLMVNVYHVLMSGAPTKANLDAIAQYFLDWENSTAKLVRSTGAALVKVVCRDISQQDGMAVEHVPTGGFTQGQVDLPLPNNVTLACKWTTGLSGRSFRGRSYWIGLARSQVFADTVNAAAITSITQAYQDLLAGLSGGALGNLAVVSRRHNKADRTTAVVTPIVAVTVDNVVDSQRRRLPGRGT